MKNFVSISTLKLFLLAAYLCIANTSFLFAQTTNITANTYTIGKGTNACYTNIAFTINEGSNSDFTDAASNVSYAVKLPPGFSFVSAYTSFISVTYSGSATVAISSIRLAGSNTVLIFDYKMSGSSGDKGSFVINTANIMCNIPGDSGTIFRVDATSYGAAANATMNANPVYNGTNKSVALSHGKVSSKFAYSAVYLSYSSNYNGTNMFNTIYGNNNTVTLCNSGYYYFYAPLSYANYKVYANSSAITPTVNMAAWWSGQQEMAFTKNEFVTNNLTGNVALTVHADVSGCEFASDSFNFKFSAAPPPSTSHSTQKDTAFAITDNPFIMNNYMNYPSASGNFVKSYSGAGIVQVDATTYSFVPSLLTPNSYTIQYTASNTTCSAVYNVPDTFLVYDPLHPLPSFATANVAAPFCAQESKSITITLTAPGGYPIKEYYVGLKTPKYSYSYNANTFSFTFNPTTDVIGNAAYVYIYYYDGTSYHFLNGSISLYPKRNVKLSGLPSTTDSVVYICSASKDTITMQGSPSGGSFSFYRWKNNKYTTIAGLGVPPNGTVSTWAFVPAELFLDTARGNRDTSIHFKVRYIYPGYGGVCPDTVIRIIKFSTPLSIGYTITTPTQKPYCDGDRFKFAVNNYNPTYKYYWNFGDGISNEADSLSTNSHVYTRPGQYNLRFKTIAINLTKNQCNNDSLVTVRIGAKPKPNFDVFDNFQNQNTRFVNLSKVKAPNLFDIGDTIKSWHWEYGIPGDSLTLKTNHGNTTHPYAAITKNPYPVMLKTTAKWGCVDSLTRYIPIFPVKIPSSTLVYQENFNDPNPNGWYASGSYRNDTVSSWVNEVPAGNDIKPESSGGKVWITSKNLVTSQDTVGYYNNENSWVESPCFDMSQLPLPMLSLNQWVNSDNLFDGVSLQYASCDSAFGKENWKTLGAYNAGLNWYNSYTVLGAPGGGKLGWTGDTQKGWELSAYQLSDVKTTINNSVKKLVRFRVVVGTNGDNTPGKRFDGFAFDNFLIGQRNRNILVEEFCDYKNFENQFNAAPFKNDPQLVRIQYHSRYMNLDDEINNQNIGETGARNLLYGYSLLPRAAVDGYYSLDYEKPFFNNDGQTNFEKRSLQISPFTISISPPSVSGNALNFKVTMTRNSMSGTTGPFVMQVAVLEKQVVGNGKIFTNVFRKFLPHASGEHVDKNNWPIGSANAKILDRSFTPFTDLTVRANPSTDTSIVIVAFIQDEATSEVYQSEAYYVPYITVKDLGKVPLPKRVNTVETGITIYPNPAQNSLAVHFNAGMAEENYVYNLLDIYGQTVASGTIEKDAQEFNVPGIQTIPVGVYQFQLLGNTTMTAKTFTIVR